MKLNLWILCLCSAPSLCFAQCGPDNVYGQISCYEKQYKIDKTLLNKTYQKLYKNYSSGDQKLLEQSQKALLNYKDLQCNQLLASLSSGAQGAGMGLINLSCNAKLTKLRLDELKGLAKMIDD